MGVGDGQRVNIPVLLLDRQRGIILQFTSIHEGETSYEGNEGGVMLLIHMRRNKIA